ncbi:MAG: hypothetical protein PHE47_06660 [Oscillospiraceae bacterium]|nr:hypothetical protein [Oscillospiraceae bacterium]
MGRADRFIPSSLEKNLKLLQMPDCIYLTERCQCGILRVKECVGKDCPFCQSKIKNEEARMLWRRRLGRIEEEKQEKIAAAYYGGKRPWKDLERKER